MCGKKVFLMVMVLLAWSAAFAGEKAAPVAGHIDIRSTLVGARVYFDGTYVGDADLFVEDVPPGEHAITMRQGSQRIFGQFIVKPGETLMLEGRFEENRIVDLKEFAREEAARRAEEERKAEAARKGEAARKAEAERKAVEDRKIEAERQAAEAEQRNKESAASAKKVDKKPGAKKTVAAASAAKAAKSPEEARRDRNVNLVRVDFADSPTTYGVSVAPKINQQVIANFTDSKSSTGKLMRTKQGQVLCEAGACLREWTGRFFYIDESGKRDAFLIRWKEALFSGVDPRESTKVEMDVCLNGDCTTFQNSGAGTDQGTIDRYVLNWTTKHFIIRRADIAREITDAGGKVPDF